VVLGRAQVEAAGNTAILSLSLSLTHTHQVVVLGVVEAARHSPRHYHMRVLLSPCVCVCVCVRVRGKGGKRVCGWLGSSVCVCVGDGEFGKMKQ